MPQAPLHMPTESEESPSRKAKLAPEQLAEIEEARARSAETRRVTAPGLEEILYTAFPVLDHGFVRVVDYMGDDAAIVQAARVSYGRGTKSVRNDAGLIRYLLRHRHTTPFEMCEIKLHVKLPIFRRAPVDPPPHRERERIFGTLFEAGSREFYVPDAAYLEQFEAAEAT